jgi:hypothetical protein
MKQKLICNNPNCKKEFLRNRGEIKRSMKLGRFFYCSLSCANKDKSVRFSWIRYQDTSHLNPGNKKDDFSSFRFHLRKVKNRCRYRKDNREISITVEDLKNQWNKQKGVCPYTGWTLNTPNATSQIHKLPITPYRASVDRIDSSKGYTVENIEFVSLIYQFAKNIWSGDEVIKFCEAVVTNSNK